MPAVIITRDEPIERAIRAALDKLPIEDLVRDCLVAVKPNDTWASPTDRSGVTQPETLRAVLRYLRRFKPRELVVSGGSGAGGSMFFLAPDDPSEAVQAARRMGMTVLPVQWAATGVRACST